MEEIYKYMLEFGFKKKEIDRIINSHASNTWLPSSLYKNIQKNNKWFLENGYNQNDIIKMVISLPAVYSLSIENIEQKIEYLISFGYTKEQVIKMTVSLPALYGYTIENIKQKVEDIISLGYTKEQVIKMAVSLPAIYSLSIENIKQKIEDLISLGYTKEQIIKMALISSAIYAYSIENIKQKVEDIISLGYTKEQVLKMTILLPSLYGSSFENIKKKIDFYKDIELDFIVLEDTKHLIQSVELSYARYNYFRDKGIIINEENFAYLFYREKRFINQFGVSKKELLLMYPYNVEEEKENVR